MKYLATLMLLWVMLLSSCGSVFLEDIKPPNLDECEFITRDIFLNSPDTVIALPFDGRRDAIVHTPIPDNWDKFEGEVYLTDLTWNIDWVSWAAMSLDGYTIAVFDEDYWDVYPGVDLYPHLSTVNNKWLRLELGFRGRGTKPAGTQIMKANAEIALCGVNAALIQ